MRYDKKQFRLQRRTADTDQPSSAHAGRERLVAKPGAIFATVSVKQKLLGLYGCILVGFLLVFAVEFQESRLGERALALERLAVSAQIEVLGMRRQEKNHFLRHDDASLAAVHRHQQAAVAAVKAIRTLDPAHADACDAALGFLHRYLADFETVAQTDMAQAGSPSAAFVRAARALEPVTGELQEYYATRHRDIVKKAALAAWSIQAAILALVGLAAWVVFRSVAEPLAAIGRHARQVARGEASDLHPGDFSGEFRALAEDIGRMESHLLATILELVRKQREAAEEAARAREARRHAEALGRVKGDFLSLVSHELKTPLTSMVGFAQVLRKRLDRDTMVQATQRFPEIAEERTRFCENLDIILGEGRRLAELIDNMLELAALETGDSPLALDTVPAADVVDKAVAPFAAAMAEKGLRFTREIPEDMPPLRCDRDRVVYVLRHLFSNAVKFTPAGHIACRVRREGDMAVIDLEDTGPGIPPEKREAVFEKFLQLGDNLTNKMPGLGIGLAASRAVMESHGGSISIDGNPGKGSMVSISVPLATAP